MTPRFRVTRISDWASQAPTKYSLDLVGSQQLNISSLYKVQEQKVWDQKDQEGGTATANEWLTLVASIASVHALLQAMKKAKGHGWQWLQHGLREIWPNSSYI